METLATEAARWVGGGRRVTVVAWRVVVENSVTAVAPWAEVVRAEAVMAGVAAVAAGAAPKEVIAVVPMEEA